MALRRWILHRMNRIGAVVGRPDLPRRGPGASTASEDDQRDAREPTFRAVPGDAREPGPTGPEYLGAYAPLIGAIRDELEHFVTTQLRLHLAIAERDRFLLVAIDVECEGDADAAGLLQRFTHEFTPEQIKRFLARDVIAHLPNASAIDLSQFGGLGGARDPASSPADEPYADLLLQLRRQAPEDAPESFRVSLAGRWIEADLASAGATGAGARASAPAAPRTPLAGSRIEIGIEDADGRRQLTLSSVIPQRRYVIGKGEGCDIAVNGTFTSRRHAEIWVDNGVWWAADAGSRNGIRVESALGLLGRAGGQSAEAGANSAIEILPGACIVLSALAQGSSAEYPRVVLAQGSSRRIPATPPATAGTSRSATPVTPIAAPPAGEPTIATPPITARRTDPGKLKLTATMASGVRTVQLGEQPLPIRVGRSRSQDLVVDWAHEGVSGHHIDIADVDGTGVEVEVHGDNGVSVDGVEHPAGHRFRWSTGEQMTLGRASGAEPVCTLMLDAGA